MAETKGLWRRIQDAPPLLEGRKRLIPQEGLGIKKTSLIVLPTIFALTLILGLVTALTS